MKAKLLTFIVVGLATGVIMLLVAVSESGPSKVIPSS